MRWSRFLMNVHMKNAIQCSFDAWYPDVESVYEDWDDEIDERGWIEIDYSL